MKSRSGQRRSPGEDDEDKLVAISSSCGRSKRRKRKMRKFVTVDVEEP